MKLLVRSELLNPIKFCRLQQLEEKKWYASGVRDFVCCHKYFSCGGNCKTTSVEGECVCVWEGAGCVCVVVEAAKGIRSGLVSKVINVEVLSGFTTEMVPNAYEVC